eukprot:jgi/Galph1/341/GphlegSOOS_G5049.1
MQQAMLETQSVSHFAPKSGKKEALKKASAKAARKLRSLGLDASQERPNVPKKEKKTVVGPVAMQKRMRTAADKEMLRAQVVVPDRSGGNEAPRVVVVMGPKGVGKSTVIRCLVKHYTKRKIGEIVGPTTVVSGNMRRLTFLEVNGDLPAMIDAAKIADLVLLVIDASFGFEMETFEFLNICAVHGMPRVIGILTHLDKIREGKKMKKLKKEIKNRFTTELTPGAKLFCFSGLTVGGEYLKREVLNLARFISVTKFRIISWRNEHPFILVDRLEDKTPENATGDSLRTVAFFGYLRGTYLRAPQSSSFQMHLPGVGDVSVSKVEMLADPCPAPGAAQASGQKKRLSNKERSIHAPMGEVSGISYDQDAIYINLPKQTIRFSADVKPESEGEVMIRHLQQISDTMDEKLENGKLDLLRESLSAVKTNASENEEEKRQSVISHRSLDMDDDDHVTLRDRESLSEQTNEEESNDTSEDDWISQVGEETQVELSDKSPEPKNSLESTQKRMKALEKGMSFARRPSNLSKWIYNTNLSPSRVCDMNHEAFIRMSSFAEDSSRMSIQELLEINSAAKEQLKKHFLNRETFENKASGDEQAASQSSFSDDEENTSMESEIESSIDSEDEASTGENALQDDRLEEKMQKKMAFDAAYDAKVLNGQSGKEADMEDMSFDEALKRKILEREAKRKQKLSNLDEESRRAVEGFSPGSYLRLEVTNVPTDFIRYFNPFYPLLLGGFKVGEEQFCHVKARLKRHRWRRGLLKCKDPLIFSIGWRRFQSIPVYAHEDPNGRQCFLKYTPEHMHCDAIFCGPRMALGTGVACFQKLDGPNTSDFRIAASGYLSEVNGEFRVMKKLKIQRFIRGMFHSELEVSKYIGAKIRTVSGIRGAIKKALKSPPGSFRATFEDLELENYCVDVQDRLRPPSSEICHLMKTLRELRVERQIPIPQKERLGVPLCKAALPFASKPKQKLPKEKQSKVDKELSVVMEPKERRERQLIQMLNTIKNEGTKKRKENAAARLAAKLKAKQKEEEEKLERRNERRKRRYALQGAAEKRHKS